jgi:hypothetical protein
MTTLTPETEQTEEPVKPWWHHVVHHGQRGTTYALLVVYIVQIGMSAPADAFVAAGAVLEAVTTGLKLKIAE